MPTPHGSVVDSAEEAAQRLHQGDNVVLLVDPAAGQVVRPGGQGRLAFFVGEADDPAVRAAAAVMAGELFGSR